MGSSACGQRQRTSATTRQPAGYTPRFVSEWVLSQPPYRPLVLGQQHFRFLLCSLLDHNQIADVQVDADALYQICHLSFMGSSNDPGLRPVGAPPTNLSTYAQPPTLVYGSAPGQISHVGGSASTPLNLWTSELSTQRQPPDLIHLVTASPVPTSLAEEDGPFVQSLVARSSFALPFTGLVSHDSLELCICNGDIWLTWCPLVWGHCKDAPTHVKWHLCTCASKSQPFCDVPKDCPQATAHLLYQVSYDHPVYTNGVSLRRFMNSCVCLTMRCPTNCLQATPSH